MPNDFEPGGPRFTMRRFVAALGCLIGAVVLQAVLPATTRARQRQPAKAETSWSLYATGAKGGGYYQPVCHQLSYFSRTPLRFDYSDDFFGWTPRSFTYSTESNLIGVVQGHRIYQVMQHIRPNVSMLKGIAYPGQKGVMQRVLVQRSGKEYCMIFQEQDFWGAIHEFRPPRLVAISGNPMLYIHEPVSGNGGGYLDMAWTFDKGVPAALRFDEVITPALERISPAGCVVAAGDPLNLKNLSYSSELVRPAHPTGPGCGSVTVQFAIKNHRLVVASEHHFPGR